MKKWLKFINHKVKNKCENQILWTVDKKANIFRLIWYDILEGINYSYLGMIYYYFHMWVNCYYIATYANIF